MKIFNLLLLTATLLLLAVCGCTHTESAGIQHTDTGEKPKLSRHTFPAVSVAEPVYEFKPVREGVEAVHDFMVKNIGAGVLTLMKANGG